MRFLSVKLPQPISNAGKNFFRIVFDACVIKFAAAEIKHQWKDKFMTCDHDEIQQAFHEHVAKGDPRDVAIFCFIMIYHNWYIKPPKV